MPFASNRLAALCVALIILTLSHAEAGRCNTRQFSEVPNWVASGYGVSRDSKYTYGFSQESLPSLLPFNDAELQSRLKTAALADLATRITAYISTKTEIGSSAYNDNVDVRLDTGTSVRSSLRLNNLGASNFYINHKTCQAYFRVSLSNVDIPISQIGGQIDTIKARLESGSTAYAPMLKEAKQLENQLVALDFGQETGINSVKNRLKIEAKALTQKISKLAFISNAENLLADLKNPRDYVVEANTLLLEFDNLDLNSGDRQLLNELKRRLSTRFDEISAVLGTDRIFAFTDSTLSTLLDQENWEIIDNQLRSFPEFWVPKRQISDQKIALNMAKEYEIKKILKLSTELNSATRFGLTQIDLKLLATLYRAGDNAVDRVFEASQTIVGRPVTNDNLRSALEQMLREIHEENF